MSFFVIMLGDGLMVKVLKCGKKGYGFKLDLEHIKKDLKFGI